MLRGFDDPAEAIAAARGHIESARRASTPAGARAGILELAAECFLIGRQHAEGLATLEEAAALPYLNLLWLDGCPLLEPLREGSRFARLRASVATRVAELWS